MINIKKIDHVGIRVKEKTRSIAFYQELGFKLITDVGFEQGHPVIMRNESGIVLNLLGPTNIEKDENILMDVDERYAGYTHIALRVESLEDTENYFNEKGFEITGRFSFKGMSAIFIRDPDRNVIEFDEYSGEEPESRSEKGYEAHP